MLNICRENCVLMSALFQLCRAMAAVEAKAARKVAVEQEAVWEEEVEVEVELGVVFVAAGQGVVVGGQSCNTRPSPSPARCPSRRGWTQRR